MLREIPETYGRLEAAPVAAPSARTFKDAAGRRTGRLSQERTRARRVMLIVERAAGAVGRHVLDLADGLARRGHDVHLIYATHLMDRSFASRLPGLGVTNRTPVMMRPGVGARDVALIRKLRHYARDHGPFDVIHGHGLKAGGVASLVVLGTSATAVYSPHGAGAAEPSVSWWARPLHLAMELALTLRTQRVIMPSPDDARAAIKRGLGRSRVAVVPHGIDVDPTEEFDAFARMHPHDELDVPRDAVVVGCVGPFGDRDARELLLRAFVRARRSAPRLWLALANAGPHLPAIRALAAELRIGDHVLSLGDRDARGVMNHFDFLAVPGRGDGSAYAALDAMAAGLPVVATASAGVAHFVSPDVNGALTPPEVCAFGEVLAALATNPRCRAAWGNASRDLASDFTLDAMVESTLRAYAVPARKSEAFHRTAGLLRAGKELRPA